MIAEQTYNCIVVLGPTASGKTRFACRLAFLLDGEIISADSRQVYKELNIGTGKDLEEYTVSGKRIPYYVIDIREPAEKFFLHNFMQECEKAFTEILSRNHLPVICGGTGLYLDSLYKDFSLTQIKENQVLREELENLSKDELIIRLKQFPEQLREHADIDSKKRVIRAIEVATFLQLNPHAIIPEKKPYRPYYIGINVSAEERKKLITERLKLRLENGLIDEVHSLLNKGISHQRLEFLGLEYKFVSLFLQNRISRQELTDLLRTAIIQFSKRQMTWFRKMEKEGVKIHWLNKNDNPEKLIAELKNLFRIID